MKLEHVAIYTHRLEELKAFYEKYFNANSNEKYTSMKKLNCRFESYFLSFDTGARVELMMRTDIPKADNYAGSEAVGISHFAFSVGTKDDVDIMYQRLEEDGMRILGEPRKTGDGYYEACVLDPDGNWVEIMADS